MNASLCHLHPRWHPIKCLSDRIRPLMYIFTRGRVQNKLVSNWFYGKIGNLWRHEPFVDDVTGLIVGAEYNAQSTISVVLATVMAHVKPIAVNSAIFMNPLAKNAVKTAQIHSWWYEETVRIHPAQRNSDLPRAYISVVDELSQRLFSSLTLCISISQRLVATGQQWYTAARPQSTLFTDFEHSGLKRSGQW